jgi:hypothetical protein
LGPNASIGESSRKKGRVKRNVFSNEIFFLSAFIMIKYL